MSLDEETLVQRVGGPAPKRRGRAFLSVLSGREVGRVYKLGPGVSVIGRGAEVDVRIIDNGVSRRHAKLVRDLDGTSKLIDLNSTNGTFVNGRRVSVESLREGDRIRIGQSATLDFRFEYAGDPEDDVRSETGRSSPGAGAANAASDVASVARAARRNTAAIEAYERTLAIREESFGPDHPAVAAILDTLGGLLRDASRFDEAFERHRRAIEIYETRIDGGPEPPELAHLLTHLGETQLAAGRPDEALVTFERSLNMLEGRRADDSELAPVRFAVARALASASREPVRAKSLAQLARDGFTAASDGEQQAGEVARWIRDLD